MTNKEKRKPRSFYRFKTLFFVGIAVTALGMIMYIGGQLGFRAKISSALALKEGSNTVKSWANSTSEVYRKFYFFDIQNPKEILKGLEKPRLLERGPYVYREVTKNKKIKYLDENTLNFGPVVTLYFEPSRSVGKESDVITFLNMPAAAMIDKSIKEQNAFTGQINFGFLALNGILDYLKVDLFLTKTIDQLMKGYDDQLLQLGKQIAPALITTDKFSLLNGENNTMRDNYTIMTGVDDIKNLGKMIEFNGKKKLDYWYSEKANELVGCYPGLVQPFMARTFEPQLFTTALGRTLTLKYLKDVVYDDFDTFEYFLPKNTFYNPKNNPENEGFCKACIGDGLHEISSLSGGTPSFASLPHFLNADTKFLKAVDGLKPDRQKHDFFFNFEPVTGVPIRGVGRLQINFILNGDENIFLTQNVKTVLLPIVWAEVEFIHNPETLNLLAAAVTASKLIKIVPLITLCIGVVCAVLSLGGLLWNHFRKSNKDPKKTIRLHEGHEYKEVNVNKV